MLNSKKMPKLFAGTPLIHLEDFDDQLNIVMDLIKEFGEIAVFGNRTRWHITQAIKTETQEQVTKVFVERFPNQEIDDEKIYRLCIGRYLQMCLCHEGYMMGDDVAKEVQRLHLLDLENSDPLEDLLALCRVHEDGGATYWGFDIQYEQLSDELLQSQIEDKRPKTEMLVMTEKEAMARISNCNLLITPTISDHKTIFFVNKKYTLPKNLPAGYQLVTT